MGRASGFLGTYDLRSRELHVTEPASQSDPRMIALGDEIDLARAALPEFEVGAFREGHLTPVFFGSAIKEIGVSDLLDALAEFGPPPRDQPADRRTVHASEAGLTALGVQDPGRTWTRTTATGSPSRGVCSGRMVRGMRLKAGGGPAS